MRLFVLFVAMTLSTAVRADDRGLAVVKQMKTEKRIALVIGNSKYPVGALRNPRTDALLMARTLEAVGFTVTTVLDADQKRLKRAIQEFGGTGQGGVSLFYYAGHALQVNGKNYMIPIDANIASEGDVEIESVDIGAVLARMSAARNRMNLVILDACRNNPFVRSFRSTGGGLAFTDAPQGTLIAYATAPGDVAADGDGANSPYTEALSRHMQTRGLEVGQMFRGVRSDVRTRTAEKQTPWESSSLEGQFYFVMPDAIEVPHVAPLPAPLVRPAAQSQTAARELEPGHLRVETNMPGAQLHVDGKPAGIVPVTLATATAGLHQLTARKGIYAGATEIVIEADRPSTIFIEMRAPKRFELGIDLMGGLLASQNDEIMPGTVSSGTDLFKLEGQLGARVKIRETDDGKHWFQLNVGLAMFRAQEEDFHHEVNGLFVAAQQTYRHALAMDALALDATTTVDITGGLYVADNAMFDIGAIVRADFVYRWFTPGIWTTIGHQSGVSAGLSIGARYRL